jgi:hypothetical protein
LAGSSNWTAAAFAHGTIVDVAAEPGSAMVTLGGIAADSIDVSTAAVT